MFQKPCKINEKPDWLTGRVLILAEFIAISGEIF